MSIESLERTKTLVEQVYERILDAICEGTLAPGDAVRQDELALQLQVSRQPVMTALGQLKSQGFLVERGRRGLQVASIDRAHFDAIYEFRSAIEPLAASLAATRATKLQVAAGKAIVDRGRQVAAAGDAHAALLADGDFHAWIYETSGNPLIVQSMQTHWQHLRRSMGEVLRHHDLAREVWNEHAAVLDAIARGDVDGAAGAISAHVTTAQSRVGRLLTNQADGAAAL